MKAKSLFFKSKIGTMLLRKWETDASILGVGPRELCIMQNRLSCTHWW